MTDSVFVVLHLAAQSTDLVAEVPDGNFERLLTIHEQADIVSSTRHASYWDMKLECCLRHGHIAVAGRHAFIPVRKGGVSVHERYERLQLLIYFLPKRGSATATKASYNS